MAKRKKWSAERHRKMQRMWAAKRQQKNGPPALAALADALAPEESPTIDILVSPGLRTAIANAQQGDLLRLRARRQVTTFYVAEEE